MTNKKKLPPDKDPARLIFPVHDHYIGSDDPDEACVESDQPWMVVPPYIRREYEEQGEDRKELNFEDE